MHKKIECWADYDELGRWCLRIKKARGRFTLDEITEIAREYENDFYALVIKAVDGDMDQYFDVDYEGDYVTLYRATEFLERHREE